MHLKQFSLKKKRIYIHFESDYFWFRNTLCCCKKRKKKTAATNKGCKVLLTIPKAINTRSWDTSKLISKSIKHPVHILRNTKECWSIHRKLYRNLDRKAKIYYFRQFLSSTTRQLLFILAKSNRLFNMRPTHYFQNHTQNMTTVV